MTRLFSRVFSYIIPMNHSPFVPLPEPVFFGIIERYD